MSKKKEEKKISLSKVQMADILSFLKPNPYIPIETANSVLNIVRKNLTEQLKRIQIYPSLIPALKKQIYDDYTSTLIQPGESVGIITACSVMEVQTQANLNTFHKAGSADKQPTTSKFSELINATSKPKAPSYTIYFKEGTDSVQELRDKIRYSIIRLTLKKVVDEYIIHQEKDDEIWYKPFFALSEEKNDLFARACITMKMNMDILYEYKLPMKEIVRIINSEYQDCYAIYSPDCFGQIDVFVNTNDIELPEETLVFVTQENRIQIYLEEVVQPILDTLVISGIEGVSAQFFTKADVVGVDAKKEWIIETENSREKTVIKNKFKNTKKTKPSDSAKRFKQLLAHPNVDVTRTLSNNVWDIYFTFGIEATRAYMIEQFTQIMKGVNKCHILLLVDRMTFNGTISSVSRYTMRTDDSGSLSKSSFEETLDLLLNAGIRGENEPVRGVSSAIICGKRAYIGSGLCELSMNVEKLGKIDELDEDDEDENGDDKEDKEDNSDSD